MPKAENTLLIGQLAAATRASADTIRYYERLKLLPKPKRTAGGYRAYDPKAADRLNFIRKAQRMGFTLEQIKSILAERDRGKAPCDSVLRMTRQRLADVEAELAHLQSVRRSLKRYLKDWNDDEVASCCAAEDFCSLIANAKI